MKREIIIIKTSIIGILSNIFLVITKTIVGLLANSLVIVLDAINNLTDVLSSTITIIGTKIANKHPDKEHPFGHGRIEYFVTLVIALLVLLTGASALKESIYKVINPIKVDYSISTLLVVTLAIILKLFLGTYLQQKGKKVKSSSLIASGKDAIYDSFISLTTLIAIALFFIFKIEIEGYLGIIISLYIIKSSLKMIIEPINDLIGVRIDPKLTKNIKNTINSFPNVLNTYDLFLTSYGPNKIIGSAHIEVNSKTSAFRIHKLTREIEFQIYNKYNVFLTLGIYSVNKEDNKYKRLSKEIDTIKKNYPEIIQIHGLYIDRFNIFFDIIMDFKVKNQSIIKKKLISELQKKYPNYKFSIVVDADTSD